MVPCMRLLDIGRWHRCPAGIGWPARGMPGSRADPPGPAAGQAKRPEERSLPNPGHERPAAEVGAPQAVAVAPCLALGDCPRRLACFTSTPELSAEDRTPSRPGP